MKRNGLEGILTSFLLVVIAIIYTFLSYYTPTGLDDWAFLAEWRQQIGDRGLSLSSLYDFWSNIRLYDNGRFSNTFLPMFLLYSPWKELFPIITGISGALIVFFLSRFAFPERKLSFYSLCIAWPAVVFLLPWRNFLFVADYSINYIWTAAITMAFICYVLVCEKNGWTLWRLIVGLFFAFIAGGWHEGFSLATVSGLLLYTLTRRDGRFSLQWWLLGVFYGGIAVANYYCPGMLDRTGKEIGNVSKGMSVASLVVDFIPVILAMIAISVYALVPKLRRGLRRAWNQPLFVISAGVVVVGVLMSLLFVHQPRSAFWPDIMALVMVLILTRKIWERIATSSFKIYVESILLSVGFLPMVFALKEQYNLYLEAQEIESKMAASENGTVYHDLYQPGAKQMLALKIPSVSLWNTAFNYEAMKRYTGKSYATILPTELSNSNLYRNADKIAGDGDFIRVGNFLLASTRLSKEPEILPFTFTLKNGQVQSFLILSLPFHSPTSQEYTYLRLPTSLSASEITRVTLE